MVVIFNRAVPCGVCLDGPRRKRRDSVSVFFAFQFPIGSKQQVTKKKETDVRHVGMCRHSELLQMVSFGLASWQH